MDEDSPDSNMDVDYTSFKFIIIVIILGLLVIIVICGNCLVIAAVFTSPKLRSVTNLFIASLATSDLLLGILVLPSSATLEILHYWVFGDLWCSMWLAVDVWMCTSQILNLCAISFDRWIAIQYPMKYPSLMSSRRGKILIACCWIISFIVCFPPLIGWNDKGKNVGEIHETTEFESMSMNESTIPYINGDFNEQSEQNRTNSSLPQCTLTSEPGYIVYSAIGSFFLPCCVMLFFYFKIYRAAKKFTKNLRRGVIPSKGFNNSTKVKGDDNVMMRVHRGGGGSRKCQTLGSRPKSSSWADDVSSSALRQGSRSSLRSGVNINRNGTRFNDRPSSLVLSRAQSDRCFNLKHGSLPSTSSSISPNTSPLLVHKNTRMTVRDNRAKTLLSMKTGLGENGRHSIREDGVENNNGVVKKVSSPKKMIFSFISKYATDSHDRNQRRHNRETKAAKTVAIIICAFIICWAPFFTAYLIGAFCPNCTPDVVFKVIFWLGYCNSAINPCIYALFSRDYRHAFKKLIHCKVRSHRRLERGRGTYVTSLRVKTDSDLEQNSNS